MTVMQRLIHINRGTDGRYLNTPAETRQSRFWAAADGGMVLVTVLILLGLMTALLIEAQVTAHLALRLEQQLCLRTELRAAAAEMAWNALQVLAADSNLQWDHTNEAWATPQERHFPNGITAVVFMTDENRFFDVNNLALRPTAKMARTPQEIVTDLCALSGIPNPAVQAQALKDWIDADLEGVREASFYKDRAPPITVPNAAMECPLELAVVVGETSVVQRLSGILAVLPANRLQAAVPVNVNTVRREVLLGMLGPAQSALVERICRQRDAHPVTSLTQLPESKKLAAFTPFLEVKSSYFSVAARAEKDARTETVYALAHRDAQGQIQVLRWICR